MRGYTREKGAALILARSARSPKSCVILYLLRINTCVSYSRRMFPVPDFCLAGLEPNQYYGCAVEVVAVDSNRYRHKSSQGWVPSGKGMPLSQSHNKYLHPNSASLGQYWMREGAIFDKLKLSNHIHPSSGNVSN